MQAVRDLTRLHVQFIAQFVHSVIVSKTKRCGCDVIFRR